MKARDYGRTYISFDWALKRLLRNKASYVILEGFLSELLKEDIKIQEFLDPENNADFADHKFSRADVLCLNAKEELILIEVQYHREEDYFQRMLFGASRVLTERLLLGQPYGKLPKVYAVHIVYFDLGVGSDYVYHGRLHFKGKHQRDELGLSALQQERFGRQDAGELFPEYYLLKINNFDEVAKDSLDEWLYYFKHSSLPQRFHAKGLTEVAEQLKMDAMDAATKAKYQKYLDEQLFTESALESAYDNGLFNGRDLGIKEGIKKGIKEGITLGQQKTLKKGVTELLAMGMNLHDIGKVFGLTTGEVEGIIGAKDLLK